MKERIGGVEDNELLAGLKSPLLEVLATYGKPVETRRKHQPIARELDPKWKTPTHEDSHRRRQLQHPGRR